MYTANSGRMTRDWYFVIGEDPDGENRGQTGEASCLADARRCVFEPFVLEGDTMFIIIRLRAGQWFQDPQYYDFPGFTGEIVERKFVTGRS